MAFVFFQPGKLKPKDLKEAIRRTRADRQRQLQEQEALRSLTATASTAEINDGIGATFEDPEGGDGIATKRQQQQPQPAQLSGRAICAYEATAAGSGGGGGGAATRQLKEMSFLQDLADTEVEERDRSFKVTSRDHVSSRFFRTKTAFSKRAVYLYVCQ